MRYKVGVASCKLAVMSLLLATVRQMCNSEKKKPELGNKNAVNFF